MLILEFMFDKSSKNWADDNPTYNLVFLRAAETYFNTKLNLTGRISLDEVLNYLGIEIPAGLSFYGWDKSRHGDVGVYLNFEDQVDSILNGDAKCILIRLDIPMDKETRKEV